MEDKRGYEEIAASFDWGTPERFNFGRDVVDRWAAEDRPAMRWIGTSGVERSFTFGDFSRLSSKFACAGREIGLRRGDRVMVLLGKVPEWHTVLTGLLKLGAIAVPCAPQLRAKDLSFRARHSGAVAVVADAPGAAEFDKVRHEIPEVEHLLCLGNGPGGWQPLEGLTDGAAEDFVAVDTAAEDGAYLMYTSGTTKNPKGVLQTQGYCHGNWMQARYWLDLREEDLAWCTAGTGWGKSVWNCFLGPWSLGVEVFFHEGGFDPEERLRLLEEHGVTVLCQAPTEYRLLAKTEGFEGVDLSKLRHAVSAGEPLNPAVIRRWKESHDIGIRDGYGQTETTLTVGNFPGLEVRPGSMGKPSPGCEVKVIDAEGGECTTDEVGDIALRAENPTLFEGYWDQPEETAAAYRGAWYLTGDRASRDADGYLWFVGRSDDVILSAGYRIGPFEIESALIEHPAVIESAVVSSPDEDRGSVVKAFVVVGRYCDPSEELAKELQDFCKLHTAPYKYPRRIEFVSELPKTTSGKIRRVELRLREYASQVDREGILSPEG